MGKFDHHITLSRTKPWMRLWLVAYNLYSLYSSIPNSSLVRYSFIKNVTNFTFNIHYVLIMIHWVSYSIGNVTIIEQYNYSASWDFSGYVENLNYLMNFMMARTFLCEFSVHMGIFDDFQTVPDRNVYHELTKYQFKCLSKLVKYRKIKVYKSICHQSAVYIHITIYSYPSLKHTN